MSTSNFANSEFKLFLWDKIRQGKNQKLCSKLRGLNKKSVPEFDESINCAATNYENLKKLAMSSFAAQIQNLKLNVSGHLHKIDDLCYISTQYFVNVKSVKLLSVNSNHDDSPIQSYKKINISNTKNLSICGLTIESDDYGQIEGYECELKISDSKFHGLEVYVLHFGTVELVGVKFLNKFKQMIAFENLTYFLQ
eukprot:TRINITY_DN4916_c0_g6_i1.p1 TRINITY_DN4916_c0_g6~~TRINITY_DN4916_c0_g6_i1.p1  ORF type:complete len:195 (-),score=11.60 TRINITY_DN4916_c0_g6_i1:193-777(-)